ncbi:methyltransferase domain-containing protein [Rhodovarius sp.]|uniref:methyltransferase domain-containing protein n=1 Tax=Rhodovarius sp. TaxID=2972673 RepID=UPI00333F365E
MPPAGGIGGAAWRSGSRWLIEGSATAMPLPDTCCGIVTAIECGFHLHTRQDFLAAAFRALRPGGRF